MACPICAADVPTDPTAKYRPFCSRRCADVDLAKWMNGVYAVPSQDPEDADRVIDALERGFEGAPTHGSGTEH